MMNLSEATSESSCKREEDGDVSTMAERPLKKARFAWQVKGKYHLKNDISESEKCASASNDLNAAGSSCTKENNCNSLVGNTEQNLEILGDYLLKQDFNTLDSVIADTDSSLLKPNTNLQPETLLYPRYVSSCDNNNYSNERSTSFSDNIIEHVPMSLVISQSYTEDQCIARWQARQMAKGFVDNTINRVLDSWMVTPLQAEMDNNRSLALGVAEFINNLPGDNSIENEGILMAISAHGLQNTSKSSSNDNFNSEQISNSLYNKDNVFLSPPTSPTISENEVSNQSNIRKEKDTKGSSSKHLPSTNAANVKKNISDHGTPLSLSPEPCSPVHQYFSEDECIETLNMEYSRNDNINECDFTNHYDFLDAAVSFAIQNKGLTSFGSDYG